MYEWAKTVQVSYTHLDLDLFSMIKEEESCVAFSRLHPSVYIQISLLILKKKIESIERVKQKNEIETLLEKKPSSLPPFTSRSRGERERSKKKINKSLLSRHFLMTQHLYYLFITYTISVGH